MAKKNKYYVVWKGKKIGIFDSWAKCSEQVSGYAGAEYKSFPNKTAAEQAFCADSRDYMGREVFASELSAAERRALGEPILESLSVDAAWDTSTGLMEYQGVETNTGKVVFKRGPFEDGTNNVGEFLAIVHAAAYLKDNGNKVPIYSDSATAMAWVRNKYANTKLARTQKNKALFALIKKAEAWLHENPINNRILKWQTKAWGEIAADFGRK